MNRMWSAMAMLPRLSLCAAVELPLALALCATPAAAQTPAARRDSSRVYRLQLRRSGDTIYLRSLRTAREQLEYRLDSLKREFDELGLDAPDRIDLERHIRAIMLSLGNLSDLEDRSRLRLIAPSTGVIERAKARALASTARALAQAQAFAGPVQLLQPGWIGINAEAPHQRIVRNDSAYIRYFSYPEVISVEPDSPAERVGIARGDYLIAYDGADLRDREINITKLLQPSRRITVTVRRDGDEREFPITVARPPARVVERWQFKFPDVSDSVGSPPMRLRRTAPTPPPSVVPAPMLLFDGPEPGFVPVIGAKLVTINDESFDRIFGVSRGVLVTEVFGDPALSSGLKGGDVIRRVEGQTVNDVSQLGRIVAKHSGDRVVELEIIRQRRTRALTLRW